ncbi:mRNA-decapping enzyme 1 [Bacillus rossius redtenbacheri]|uniref:mRNA-decapping enzyme 1 n=1 Tax=Bacillus rossius redtenbacheri TaxID=93214 RepID=UPI002FDC8DB4
MAKLSEGQMNVAALKRVDPYVREILATATHVALYNFSAEDNEWEKTDVEGALFVYKRSGEPFNSILIMNRLNTKNLIEPVTIGLELQLKEPFLLYRNVKGQIFGVWFYDKDECVRISSILNKLAAECSLLKKLPNEMVQVACRPEFKAKPNVDIFSLLSKAKENYNSHKQAGTVVPKLDVESIQQMPQGVVDFFVKASRPNGSSQLAAEKVGDVFLSHHVQKNGHAIAGLDVTKEASRGENLKPLLQRLMSNPAHSVEHIEKQQRSVTPQFESSGTAKKAAGKDFLKHGGSVNKCNFFSEESGSKLNTTGPTPGTAPEQLTPGVHASQDVLEAEEGGDLLRGASPLADSLAAEYGDQRSLSAPLCGSWETPQTPALMPPTMFTSTPSQVGAVPVTPSQLVSLEEGQLADVRPEPLTKRQLLQATSYLLKHDPDFINKLHEAYVKSFSELVS